MIDKYRLEDLRRESGEKGELARWVIQLQKDLDDERRKSAVRPPDAVALLAACEQEPVAVVELSDYVTAAQLSGDEPRKKAVKELYEGALVIGQNLYTHPAPSLKPVGYLFVSDESYKRAAASAPKGVKGE